MDVALLRADNIDQDSSFSVSFKIICDRDINKLCQEYTIIKERKTYPVLIEKKIIKNKKNKEMIEKYYL